MADTSPESGRFAYDGLQRELHERARLGILTSLVANSAGLLFSELKDLCSLTDGNLSRHIEVLRNAGLVESRCQLAARWQRPVFGRRGDQDVHAQTVGRWRERDGGRPR